MCCSINLYGKYIYSEYFMVYLLRIRGWSLRTSHKSMISLAGASTGQCLSPSPSMLTPYSPTLKHNNMEGVRKERETEPKVHSESLHFSFNSRVFKLFTNGAFPTDHSSSRDGRSVFTCKNGKRYFEIPKSVLLEKKK